MRSLAGKLESRGLDARIVTYSGDAHEDDEDVEVVVVTNPAAPERGEFRVGDDGSVTWEYWGKLDEAGADRILETITNALRGAVIRAGQGSPS